MTRIMVFFFIKKYLTFSKVNAAYEFARKIMRNTITLVTSRFPTY